MQSLSSFNPTTNITMSTGAVQPRFSFKIVQSLAERISLLERTVRNLIVARTYGEKFAASNDWNVWKCLDGAWLELARRLHPESIEEVGDQSNKEFAPHPINDLQQRVVEIATQLDALIDEDKKEGE